MAMRILVDTNILLDYLQEREPYAESARFIVNACAKGIIKGCIAAHSVSNIFFILRKWYSVDDRKKILYAICNLFDVEGIDKGKIVNALQNTDFSDFEDCLQMECAMAYKADYIVTRNMDDFIHSSVPCIEPDKLCEILEKA